MLATVLCAEVILIFQKVHIRRHESEGLRRRVVPYSGAEGWDRSIVLHRAKRHMLIMLKFRAKH
jgi:hypothetical protein